MTTFVDQIRTDLQGRVFLDSAVEKRLLRQGVNAWGLSYSDARQSVLNVSSAAGVALQSDVEGGVLSFLETQATSTSQISRANFERAAALYRARSRDRVSLAYARSRVKALMLQRNLLPRRHGWIWRSRRWFDAIPDLPSGIETAPETTGGETMGATAPVASSAVRILNTWAAAVNARNPQAVTQLYAPSALLLATGSAEPRRGPREIIGYFQTLLAYPQFSVAIEPPLDTRGVDPVVVSGLYVFSWIGQTGEVIRVPARYSFALSRGEQTNAADTRGVILMHHSSALPGSPGASQL